MTPFLDQQQSDDHKALNRAQTYLLLAGIAAIMLLSAWLISSWTGVVMALVSIGILIYIGPRIMPELVMKMYRAKPIDPKHGGQLTQIVEVLADRAELPAHPKLYIVPSMLLNAFATGTHDHSTIALTEGLMRKLSMREITGVLAHEMSHIRNNDLAVMGLADSMSRVTQMMSYLGLALAALNIFGLMSDGPQFSWVGIVLLYFAPAAGSLLQMGLSRTREFDADLEAVQLTGDPTALGDALQKLDHTHGRIWDDLSLPVPGRKIPIPSLLRSHPSTRERLARLSSYSLKHAMPPVITIDEPMISLVGMGPIEMRPRYRWTGVWF